MGRMDTYNLKNLSAMVASFLACLPRRSVGIAPISTSSDALPLVSRFLEAMVSVVIWVFALTRFLSINYGKSELLAASRLPTN